MELSPLYHLFNITLFNLRKFGEGIQLLERMYDIKTATLADDDPDRLRIQHQLAVAYRYNRDIEQRLRHLEHAIEARATLAEDNPDRLSSQQLLARAYIAIGQVEKAVQLLEHVVKIRDTTLAEDDQARLASQHKLAVAYMENGQIEEAVQLQKHAVKIDATLAEDHPFRSRRLFSAWFL